MLVIYNPAAGRGRSKNSWPMVEQALHNSGVNFDVAPTASPLEAIRLAEKAADHYTAVISVGGDGTTHEIINGMLHTSGELPTLPLGILPLGTGDDFVKMVPPETPIGGRPFGWEHGVEKIARGQVRNFDVLRIRGDGLRPGLEHTLAGGSAHYAINSLSLGFGAQAAYQLTQTPKYIKGFAAYLAAILKTMLHFPVLKARFWVDGSHSFEQASTITAVMNGRCFGNGFWVAPDARADDGLLDLVVAQDVDRPTILRMIPKLMKGTHVHEPIVDFYQARHLVIESDEPLVVESDGETPYTAATRLEIEVLPGRVPIFV